MTFSVPYEILLAAEKIERGAKENNHEAFRIGNVVFTDETMTTTREEAERIAETDDVASALRYLVDSHSTNAAVDLVQAVMDAVRTEAHEDKAVGGTYKDSSITKALIYNGVNLPVGTLLYTHPAPPSELVQAVDNLLKVFDETDPEINCYLHGAIDALKTIRKEKP